MLKIFMCLFAIIIYTQGVQACVTYNPSDGTYTVDKSGSVNR